MGRSGKPPPRKKLKSDEQAAAGNKEDTDTSQQMAEDATASRPGRGRPAASLSAPEAAVEDANRQRRGTRRQGGAGTTSAGAGAAPEAPSPAPKAPTAFGAAGRSQRFTADSDTIMEAVVKVRPPSQG
eukprot:gene10690-10848_t